MSNDQEYELAFKNYDVNKDGVISVDELCDLLKRVGPGPAAVKFHDCDYIVIN